MNFFIKLYNFSLDLFFLQKFPLPPYGKKNAIKNIVQYLLLFWRSLSRKYDPGITVRSPLDATNIWNTFDRNLAFHQKYFSPTELLGNPVLIYAAGGYSQSDGPGFDNPLPGDDRVMRVSEELRNCYPNFPLENWRRWLSSYYSFLFPDVGLECSLADRMETLNVVEFGPGIGAYGLLCANISPNRILGFDLATMSWCAKQVYRHHRSVTSRTETDRIEQFCDYELLVPAVGADPYCFISHWAFTECDLELRRQFEPLLAGSEFCVFAANRTFGSVDNEEYFAELAQRLTGHRYYKTELKLDNLPGYQKAHRLHVFVKLDDAG